MITIAITGGYATGKTVVVNIFKKLGADVIYVDKLAHRIMRPHTQVWQDVVRYFGEGILEKDDQIDRRKLAGVVFTDKKKLKRLNRIVHPVVIDKLKGLMQDKVIKKRADVLVVEIPLLFEVGLMSWFTKVIVVSCSRVIQYKRIKGKLGISKKDFLARIRSQWPVGKKKKLADFVVDNSGTMAETRRQVVEIWEKLNHREHREKI